MGGEGREVRGDCMMEEVLPGIPHTAREGGRYRVREVSSFQRVVCKGFNEVGT